MNTKFEKFGPRWEGESLTRISDICQLKIHTFKNNKKVLTRYTAENLFSNRTFVVSTRLFHKGI
jgi:hypothetical protein